MRSAAPQAVERRAERHGSRPLRPTGVQPRSAAMSTNADRVEDLGQQLDAVDDARTGSAEVRRAVERVRPRPCGPPARSSTATAGRRVFSHSCDGLGQVEPARDEQQHLGIDLADRVPGRLAAGSPSAPSRSQPPARRTCSGTQWPEANGGSSHSRPTTRARRPASRRRSRTRFSTAPAARAGSRSGRPRRPPPRPWRRPSRSC